MDTNRLKRFATEARNKLRQGVVKKLLALGFDEEGNPSFFPQQLQGTTLYRGQQLDESFYARWTALYEAIRHQGVKAVCEEVAYTWFNRLVAIRILQKNGFIDRVLAFDNADIRVPHIVSEARQGRFPAMSTADRLRLRAVIGDPGKTYEQFSLLITVFCHDNAIISTCFGTINDYTALLLPDDILDADGFVDMLNRADYIGDDDYRTTELLGWLYQFYISERKDDVFASFKKGHKAEADDIAPATQIFTPNWIVKYMVQNTLGRIWLDNNPGDALEARMQYLVPKAGGGSADSICRYGSLEDLRVIDPACGSGHILLEAFDLLYDMYMTEFYSREEAITCIFTKNLTGIDIDTRAKQLAMFALLLKACQRDRAFLEVPVRPRVLDMPVCDAYTVKDSLGHFLCAYGLPSPGEESYKELVAAFDLMKDAGSLGSIMRFDVSDDTRSLLEAAVAAYDAAPSHDEAFGSLVGGFRLILALTARYTCVVANPPYMGSGNMNEVLSKYVKENYTEGKADLATVFVQLFKRLTAANGCYAFIIPPSWMFLSAFESLRKGIIGEQSIESLLHLSRGVFGADFGSVATVIKNICDEDAHGTYFRLVDRTFQEFDQKHLRTLFDQTLADHDFRYRYKDYSKDVESLPYSPDGNQIFYPNVAQKNFEKIPGRPIGYWVSERMRKLYSNNTISDYSKPRAGICTGYNEGFLKLWHEINPHKLGNTYYSDYLEALNQDVYSWYIHYKGGGYRRWYGNRDYVLHYSKDVLAEMENYKGFRHDGKENFFKEGITWSKISSGLFSARLLVKGCTFDSTGTSVFPSDGIRNTMLGLLNSKTIQPIINLTNPTMAIYPHDIAGIPFILPNDEQTNTIDSLVSQNISLSKSDWDAHETSWDFQSNPLLAVDEETYLANIDYAAEKFYRETGKHICIDPAAPQLESLEWRMEQYKQKWERNFMQLHANEEELNRQFIGIYGLEDELTPDVPLSEITILQQGEISIDDNELKWHDDVIVKQLISYAIGCMMGRYSIDKPGLILANQDDGVEQYKKLVPGSRFAIDDDGIVPLFGDDSPFSDNAVSRLSEFVKTALGAEHLTQNLNYMEQALGKSLGDYLQKDFWRDHCRMYQNRPIYWLFASRKGAFQVVAYMHRMDAYTVGKVRNKYLLPYIEWLKQRIDALMARQAELSAPERKQLKDFGKSLEECREYDVRLHEVANRQIGIDLDDGVVVNYAKYGDILQKLK